MRFITTVIFAFIYALSWSAEPYRRCANNPISSAMGSIVLCSPHYENPAVSTTAERRTVNLSYHNEYCEGKLGEWNTSLLLPTHWATHITRFSHFGFEDYRLFALGYGLGKRISEHWCLGTYLRYQSLYFTGCERETASIFNDTGIFYEKGNKYQIGVLFRNLASARLTQCEEATTNESRSIVVSSAIKFLDNARWLVEGEENDQKAWELRNGFEFIYERMTLRCGFRMLPIVPSLGCGFDLKWFRFDVSSFYHNQLGYSLAVGLSSNF